MVNRPENSHYQAWANAGLLIVTPGNMIDLEQIQEDILSSAETVVIREVAKDPYGGHQLGSNLALEGIEVVDIPQHVKYLSEPMKTLQALIDSGDFNSDGGFTHRPRFHHDANDCYIWQLSNVEVKPDRNENIFPRKLKMRGGNKIDAAVATIVCMNRLMAVESQDVSFWEANEISA
jgi:phage terminase large subunit-like protein